MPEHDPFPMRSEEARRLEESVQFHPDGDGGEGDHSQAQEQGRAGSSWLRMPTFDRPLRMASAELGLGGGRTSLMGGGRGKGKRKGKGGDSGTSADSIYDAALEAAEDAAKRDYEGDDDFLDVSLDDRHGPLAEAYRSAVPLPVRRALAPVGRGLRQLHERLYGNALPPREMLRTMCMATTLFFMIGGYWLLRSLKDPVLTALCGVAAIPKAKMASVFVVLAVVSIYNRLLDHPNLPRHRLFYIFGTFYFGLFTTISILLSDPVMGLPNQVPNQNRWLGWVSYCGIESFGSVMVSLFWSFANSNTNLETAKASYGLLVATAQLGSILGPTIVARYTVSVGVPRVYFIGALCMLLLQASMYSYVAMYGTDETNAQDETTSLKPKDEKSKKNKEKAGVLEGLHLFARHNYVKGIFAISCLFMVEVTIVDYTMKVLARDHFAAEYPCSRGNSCWDSETDSAAGMSVDATAAFTTFMGMFGQATNGLSFLLSLLGTAAVIRTLGLRITLLLFPSLCLAVIILVRIRPTLYVVFAAMMVLKANSYALNNPTKEMLYQPTAPNVKYKAKSWIDIFGARGSKALGSLITNFFSDNAQVLIQNGSLVGMAVASFLIWNARFMGRKFDQYMASGHIVGGDDNDNDDDADDRGARYGGVGTGLEMAASQNEDERDTSCAVPLDDDEITPEDEGHGSDEGSVEEEASDDEGEADWAGRPKGIAKVAQV